MVQEGDAPPENPDELLAELERVATELAGLIKRINRTNSQTEFRSGATLADALAERDVTLLKREAYNQIVQNAALRQDRYSKSEVKFISTVKVQQLQRRMDDLSKEARELDARIQEMNWRVELAE